MAKYDYIYPIEGQYDSLTAKITIIKNTIKQDAEELDAQWEGQKGK